MATVDQAVQWIIDNAAAITIDGRGVVASTISRSGVVRSVSRGGRTWKFTVSPSPSLMQDARPYLARLDQVDRIQVATIDFDRPLFADFFAYQGQGFGTFAATPSVSTTTELTLQANAGGATGLTSGGRLVRAGDYLQMGSTGSLYQVIEDTAVDANPATVTVNRPIDEATGVAYIVNLGQNCSVDVICVTRPTWSLQPAGGKSLVTWSGDFVFYEDRT